MTATYERARPKKDFKDAVQHFKKKYKKTKMKKGRIVTVLKHKHREPEPFLKEVFKDKYLKGKVKRCRMKSLS